MKIDLVILVSFVLTAVTVGSLAAFFLFVSPLIILYAATLVTGVTLVFTLRLLAAERQSEAIVEPEAERRLRAK